MRGPSMMRASATVVLFDFDSPRKNRIMDISKSQGKNNFAIKFLTNDFPSCILTIVTSRSNINFKCVEAPTAESHLFVTAQSISPVVGASAVYGTITF